VRVDYKSPNMTSSACRVITALCVLLSLLLSGTRVTGQDWNKVPDCNMDHATQCIDQASDAALASGCNWFRIIGPLYVCIDMAVAGCTYDEQETMYNIVGEFNKTLQEDSCNERCQSQDDKANEMWACFTTAGFDSLIPTINSNSAATSTDAGCMMLSDMDACLKAATSDCPALTDVSYNKINSVDGSAQAYTTCGVQAFQEATTLSAVVLPDTGTPIPMQASTTKPKGLNGGELVLVILGSIVIAATIIVIIIVIVLTVRRRRAAYRRSILRDWRPNGHKVYLDDPQFSQTQEIRPAHSPAYRPYNFSNTSGFLNEAGRVQ